MLPIPPFDPRNLALYPQGMGKIDVGAADAGSKLLLYNLSPANMQIDFLNGNISLLHAGEVRYWTLDGDTRQVEWKIISVLNITNPPISELNGELYRPDEKIEGQFPFSLLHQISVGNPGGLATTSSGTTIVNDGNAAGVSIIETTVSGQSASSVSLTNDALMRLAVIVAGTLIQVLKTNITDPVLQLGAAGKLVEVLGNLKVAGVLNAVLPGSSITSAVANATYAANVPASGIGAGAIPGGVTIPQSQVTGGSGVASQVPAAGVQAGTLNAAVLLGYNLPASQIAGDVASSTLAQSANALNGGGNLPGGRLGILVDGDRIDCGSSYFYLKIPTAIIAQIAGRQTFHVDANGIGIDSGSLYFRQGDALAFIRNGTTGSFVGTLVVTHNLSISGNYKVFLTGVGSGSTTFSVPTKTANSFTIYTYNTMAFDWMIFAQG